MIVRTTLMLALMLALTASGDQSTCSNHVHYTSAAWEVLQLVAEEKETFRQEAVNNQHNIPWVLIGDDNSIGVLYWEMLTELEYDGWAANFKRVMTTVMSSDEFDTLQRYLDQERLILKDKRYQNSIKLRCGAGLKLTTSKAYHAVIYAWVDLNTAAYIESYYQFVQDFSLPVVEKFNEVMYSIGYVFYYHDNAKADAAHNTTRLDGHAEYCREQGVIQ